jgi:hypothetical protein
MRFRSLEGLGLHCCPFCVRRIVSDPGAAMLFHEEPTCARYEAKMRAFGLHSVTVEPTAFALALARKGGGN